MVGGARVAVAAAVLIGAAVAAFRLVPGTAQRDAPGLARASIYATARPAGTPLPTRGVVPKHVETWVGYCYGAHDAGCASSPATVRRWATYVESTNVGAPKSVRVCNVPGHPCNSVAYINSNNEYFGECGWSDPVINGGLRQQGMLAESAWLHAGPALTYANRLFIHYKSSCAPASANTGLWVNRHSISGPGNALSWFNRFYQQEWGASTPDYYMSDDTTVFNYFGGKQAYEYTSWTDVQRAQAVWLSRQLDRNGKPVKTFFNGCNNNTYIVSGVGLIKAYPNIEGCITEGNVSAANMSNGRDVYALDNCARVSRSPNGGVYVNGPDGDGTLLDRRQATAFNLLCYLPGGRVVLWEEFDGTGNYINAFPEAGLYPTRPLQSMRVPRGCPDAVISPSGPGNDGTLGTPCTTHGHNDLLVAGSSAAPVERREFARCYNQGVDVGRCAVIWNMTGSPVTVGAGWLAQDYTRMIALTGGSVDEQGVLLFSPVTPSVAVIPAYDALFLVQ